MILNMRFISVAPLWLCLIFCFVCGCSHSRKIEFRDFFSTNRRSFQDYEPSKELSQLLDIQKKLDQRSFHEALKKAQSFQKRNAFSKYNLWVKVMEGLALEGTGQLDPALECFQAVIQSTAGERGSSLNQIQSFALYHQGRVQNLKGDAQRGLASFLDAFNRKELLPQIVSQVELPLEIARAYSLLGNEKASAEFEVLSAEGFKSFLKEERLSSSQRGSILLRLGWRENFIVKDLGDSRFLQAEQQKNLYLLAAIQTEVDPFSKIASSNLMTILSTLKKPLEQKEPSDVEARIEFRQQKKIYGETLADLYREMALHIRPASLRGPREREFAQFFDSSKSILLSLLKDNLILNELTVESEKRNSLKREFRSKRFMPLFPHESSIDTQIQPSGDPNL